MDRTQIFNKLHHHLSHQYFFLKNQNCPLRPMILMKKGIKDLNLHFLLHENMKEKTKLWCVENSCFVKCMYEIEILDNFKKFQEILRNSIKC